MAGRRVVRGQRINQVKLARAKEFRRSMTPEEASLWEELRGNKLRGVHFRRQQLIDGLIADFYCNDAGLVIQVDGPIHEASRDYDRERDLVFKSRGLTVLHFTNEDIRIRPQEVLQVIRLACGHDP